jgi:hypothetical protein
LRLRGGIIGVWFGLLSWDIVDYFPEFCWFSFMKATSGSTSSPSESW